MGLLNMGEKRNLKQLQELVEVVNSREAHWQNKTQLEMKEWLDVIRKNVKDLEGDELVWALRDELPDVYAIVRETSKRLKGQRHFDVQILGGIAMAWGNIAEMRTGEGKTLTATLPAVLFSLSGKGVHVVTVNDYLAKRDCEWMKDIYQALGVRLGYAQAEHSQDRPLRKLVYSMDVTYITGQEAGFDYLRDHLVTDPERFTQRGHFFALVDEADSILLDEARTPMIISSVDENGAGDLHVCAQIAQMLKEGVDYDIDVDDQSAELTEEGIDKIEKATGLELYDVINVAALQKIRNAVMAEALFKKDVDYIVDDGEIKIVDHTTGRAMEGRRWEDGLHQAVEAKENLEIQGNSATMASITVQNYFKLYENLCGMTGTAKTDASELHATYEVDVVEIPTNKPNRRVDHPDIVHKDDDAKIKAAVKTVKELHETGRPVLVGTSSVEKSEKLSLALTNAGLDHNVLNAKEHRKEAELISQAGRKGKITVATNMAGRGVDILLGGDAEKLARQELENEGLTEDDDAWVEQWDQVLEKWQTICDQEKAEVTEAGGLYVLGLEKHESQRIDNQLRGRSGRQGDPGDTRFLASLEDDLFTRMGGKTALSGSLGKRLAGGFSSKTAQKALDAGQRAIENKHKEARSNITKYDEAIDYQRRAVYKLRDELLFGDGDHLQAEFEADIFEQMQEVVNAIWEGSDQGDSEEAIDEYRQALKEALTEWGVDVDIKADNETDAVEEARNAVFERLSEREKTYGRKAMRSVQKFTSLMSLDAAWVRHLEVCTVLRDGIGFRVMAQKDPLIEWRYEVSAAFEEMTERWKRARVRTALTLPIDDLRDGDDGEVHVTLTEKPYVETH